MERILFQNKIFDILGFNISQNEGIDFHAIGNLSMKQELGK